MEVNSLVAICPECHEAVVATEVSHHIYSDGPAAPNWRFSLLTCPSDGSPMIIYGEDGHSFEAPIWLYPVSLDDSVQTAIPAALRAELIEARKCAAHGLNSAAAVMCGRVLEGVAALHGYEERSLLRGLERLRQSGVLDGKLVDWASELRTLRNEAAHFGNAPVSREDAADILALTHAILEYVYVIAARFEDFRRRRHGADDSTEGRALLPP